MTSPRDPDPGIVQVIGAAARDPRPVIRSEVVYVIGCLRWPGLRPSVLDVLRLDPHTAMASSTLLLLDLMQQAEEG